MNITETSLLVEYLEKRSSINIETQCRIWTSYVQPHAGYGQGHWKGKTISAHILAYKAYHELALPRIDSNGKKLVVRHTCNNRLCIAKEHLELGTCKQNCEDMILAGTVRYGEKHPASTIDEEMARKIIDSKFPFVHPEYKTAVQRAKEFGVSLHVVYHIDSNRVWKHIERETVINPKKRKHTASHGERYNNATITENKAKLIIASKKHKWDPTHLSQRQRAERLDVSLSILQAIDANRSWQYLRRPDIMIFPKPAIVWDEAHLAHAFQRVKQHCKYSTQNNQFVGSPCLEWEYTLIHRRPYIMVYGKSQPAYVFACEYASNMIKPEGLMTRHLCNNRICCEPSHLKFGTAQENGHDLIMHGSSKGFKLTHNDVLDIRQLYERDMDVRALCTKYNVGYTCIFNIIHGNTWNIDRDVSRGERT